MRCVGCGSAAVTERPDRTAQGRRRFRCRDCGKQFNGRSAGLLNRARCPADVIAPVVLWRLRYRLTLRDLSEVFLHGGIVFSHKAARDREAKLAPVLSDELRQRRRGKGGTGRRSWFVDETYRKVRGLWCYLYRAIDRAGDLVDTMLSERRDKAAAKAFFRSARSATGLAPDRVTTDGHGSYPRAVGTTLGRRVVHRTSAYENNGLEQSRRGIKGRVRCVRGFRSFAAERFCRSHFAAQSCVLRVDGRTILVDTCIGEQKDRPEIPAWSQRRGTGFLERLAKAGVDPADVDVVFCTHLHVDHVGWNTRREDGRWAPAFPNARYLIGHDELADWMAQRDAGSAPAVHVRALQDSVLPVVEAGLVDLVEDGYDVAEGLTLTRLPGHTAGQMGLRIPRHDGRAVFCGNALRSPVQIFEPGVSKSSCADPRVAAATRRALLGHAVETGSLVVPAHFRGRRCAHIRRSSAGFEPVFNCRPR